MYIKKFGKTGYFIITWDLNFSPSPSLITRRFLWSHVAPYPGEILYIRKLEDVCDKNVKSKTDRYDPWGKRNWEAFITLEMVKQSHIICDIALGYPNNILGNAGVQMLSHHPNHPYGMLAQGWSQIFWNYLLKKGKCLNLSSSFLNRN